MIKLYCESWRETLKRIEDQSVQMVFLDPPYGINVKAPLCRPEGGLYNGMANVSWDTQETLSDWQNEAPEMLTELKRIMTRNATGFMCGTYHNIFDMGVLLREMGFWILNKIIWQKTNPIPNLSGARLCASYEELIWFKRDKKSPYLFNYQEVKKYNNGKQLKDIWTLGTASGNERLRDPETGSIVHPSQKPESLLERVVEMSTLRGDLLFDPFSGTGTSLRVAQRLDRRAIGSEIDSKYAYLAQRRLDGTLG